jgi:acetyltransferase-like isoleucine patch superfamily enzyme
MRRCWAAPILDAASEVARLRIRALRLASRLEGGQYFSLTARAIMRRHFGVEIGDYSYGSCFDPELFPPGVTVGRYVSIASGVRVFRRNHPLDRPSLHPAFYNPVLGLVDRDQLASRPLVIEHESWIGANAIITPGCDRIGIGAVVGAGAVVTRPVPDFTIAVGNPARVLRQRFSGSAQARLLRERSWELPLSENAERLAHFLRPLEDAD